MMNKKSKDPRDNLMQNRETTPKERRENAKKAGKASGKARRKRKQLKDLFISILSTPIPQDYLKEKIISLGLDNEEKNYNTLIGMTTLTEALKGNMKAIELIRDTIGEKPKEELEVSDVTPKWFKSKEDEEEQEEKEE